LANRDGQTDRQTDRIPAAGARSMLSSCIPVSCLPRFNTCTATMTVTATCQFNTINKQTKKSHTLSERCVSCSLDDT